MGAGPTGLATAPAPYFAAARLTLPAAGDFKETVDLGEKHAQISRLIDVFSETKSTAEAFWDRSWR